MLAVQVQYWDLQERKRHNTVTERQGDRNLNIMEANQKETVRHNLVSEQLGWANLDETKRHNIVTESISRDTYYVNAMNADTNRMNAATNAAMVPIAQQNADTNRIQAENTKWYNEQIIPIQNRQSDIAEYRAQHDFIVNAGTLGSRQGELALGYENLNVKQQQVEADVFYKHANVDLQQQQININQEQLNLQRAEEARKYIETGKDTVMDAWRNLNGTIGVVSK